MRFPEGGLETQRLSVSDRVLLRKWACTQIRTSICFHRLSNRKCEKLPYLCSTYDQRSLNGARKSAPNSAARFRSGLPITAQSIRSDINSRKNQRAFSIEVRNFKLWEMPK